MCIVILIRRRGNNLSKFFELFESQNSLSIKEIKLKTSSSTFYKIILKEIFDINETIKNIDPALEFIRPVLKLNGSVCYALEKPDNVSIRHDDRFFLISFT